VGAPVLEGNFRIDGRIVAMGWNHFSPSRWVRGVLENFIQYWNEAVDRPLVVGSDYNPGITTVRDAFVRGIPVWMVARFGDLLSDQRGRFVYPSGQALRRMMDISRAMRRMSYDVYRHHLSKSLLRILGRMSPEAQHIVISWVENDIQETRWATELYRPASIPWGALGPEILKLQDPHYRCAMAMRVEENKAPGQRALTLAGASGDNELARWLCPSYKLPLELARRVAMGESLSSLSDGQLTRKETHHWLSQQNVVWQGPLEWFCMTLGRGVEPNATYNVQLRSWNVARWVERIRTIGQWDQLTRERTIIGPGGQVITIRWFNRLDEIQDEDLIRGVQTTPNQAFTHAAERAGEAWMKKMRGDHRVLTSLPRGWRPFSSMRLLNTPASLVEEGTALKHCVGGYVDAVERGSSLIFGIDVIGHRSTLEIDRNGRVLQHRGESNGYPHELNRRLVQMFLRRLESA